jgi:hypothetical protein
MAPLVLTAACQLIGKELAQALEVPKQELASIIRSRRAIPKAASRNPQAVHLVFGLWFRVPIAINRTKHATVHPKQPQVATVANFFDG